LIDNTILTEQIYLQKLQQTRQGLMGDLLSGKKDAKMVKEAEDYVK